MALHTFTVGEVLTAALQNEIATQAIARVTSGTRPSSPTEGQPIYETDTHKHLFYAGSTDSWQQAWNQPWGIIAQATVTGSQSGITTIADITSATSGSLTAIANRRWRISGIVPAAADATAADDVTLSIDKDGSTLTSCTHHVDDTVGMEYSCWALDSPSAGTHTYKLRFARTGGGSITTGGASTAPITILVEDIGPNGSPS